MDIQSQFQHSVKEDMMAKTEGFGAGNGGRSCEMEDYGFCAICLNKIILQETATVKGCEHAYCVTCILRWATYKEIPSCPQCKLPFEFLNVHRSLDGCIHDYMFEESVCLLLRASWFVPVTSEASAETYNDAEELAYELEEYLQYEDELDDMDGNYFTGQSSSIRIGNRRWGDNGYVRAGRKEARPVIVRQLNDSGAGSSRGPRKTEASNELKGRRAKRALKREAADKAAAAAAALKHQQHLLRLGRK